MKFLVFMMIVFLLMSCSIVDVVEGKRTKSGKSKHQKSVKKSKKSKPSTKRSKSKDRANVNVVDKLTTNLDAEIVYSGLENVNVTHTQLISIQERGLETIRNHLNQVFGDDQMRANTIYAWLPTGYSKIDEILGIAYLLSAHSRYEESDMVFRALLNVRNDIYSAIYGLADTYLTRSDTTASSKYAYMYVSMHDASPVGHFLLSKIAEATHGGRSKILQHLDEAYRRLDATNDTRIRSSIVLSRGQNMMHMNQRELAVVNFDQYYRWNVMDPKEALAVANHDAYVDKLKLVPPMFYRLYVETLLAIGDVDQALRIIDQVLDAEADKSLYLNEQQKRAAEDSGISLTKHMYMLKITTLVDVTGQWQEAIETLEELRAILVEELDESLLERVFSLATPDRDYLSLSLDMPPAGADRDSDLSVLLEKKYPIYVELLRYYADVEHHIGRLERALLLYTKVFDFTVHLMWTNLQLNNRGEGKGEELKSSKEQIYRVSNKIVSCLTALGRYREAVHVSEAVILETIPTDSVGYYRDIAVAWWAHLNSRFETFNPDLIVEKDIKSGLVTHGTYVVPGASEFDMYFGGDDSHLVRPENIADCVIVRASFEQLSELLTQPGNDAVPLKLSEPALVELRRVFVLEYVTYSFGGWIQLQSPGFYPNTRLLRGFALAVLHMAQKLRAHSLLVRKRRKALDDAGCEDIESETCHQFEPEKLARGLYVADAGSSRSNYTSHAWSSGTSHDHRYVNESARTHLLEYRDLADLAVRYRQYGDPQTPIFWVDNMPAEALLEFNPSCGGGSYSLATPLVSGEKKSTRYYSNYELAFNHSRNAMRNTGYYRVGQSGNVLETVSKWFGTGNEGIDVTSLHDLYSLAEGRDHWVMTVCKSRIHGLELEGSRLTVNQQQVDNIGSFAGGARPLYSYDLKTPTTWKRVHAYEQQLQQSFGRLVDILSVVGVDVNTVLRNALEMFYYWVNFAVLTRGTAFVGYSFLFSSMLAHGYQITSRIPPGRQIDWEAILYGDLDTFISHQLEWITVEPISASVSIPTVDPSRKANKNGSSDDMIRLLLGESPSNWWLLDSPVFAMDNLFSTPREVIAALHGGISVTNSDILQAVLGMDLDQGDELYPDVYEL